MPIEIASAFSMSERLFVWSADTWSSSCDAETPPAARMGVVTARLSPNCIAPRMGASRNIPVIASVRARPAELCLKKS